MVALLFVAFFGVSIALSLVLLVVVRSEREGTKMSRREAESSVRRDTEDR
ncbi:MAG: hypothetical protein ABEJ59_02470 [Halanaeroarchaeum sp.]